MKKAKILVLTLVAGLALHQPALGQTNAPDAATTPPAEAAPAAAASETPPATPAEAAPAAPAATNTSVAPAEASANAAMETDTNAAAGNPVAMGNGNPPVSATASNEPAPAEMSGAEPAAGTAGVSNAMTTATGSNQPVAAVSENGPAAEREILLQDIPLTTAIEALARQAGINYLLDPKIGYGQPNQNGQIKPEPTLSIRWEHVTPRQALLALLDNYGLQLIPNPKTGIARITIKPPNELPPLVTRVIQLQYSSTSNMVEAVKSTLSDPRSRVVADPRTSQLVVVATEDEQAAVDTLVSNLDKPTRQVLIETKLVELSSNPSTVKGIDWSGTLQAQNVSFGNGFVSQSGSSTVSTSPGSTTTTSTSGGGSISTTTPAGTSVSGQVTTSTESGNGGFSLNTASGLFPDVGFLSADGLKAVLSFLNQSTEAQVMSTPRVVTLDNETATISVTRAFPVINVTAGTVQTAGGSAVTYSNLGTVLEVTPRISANDYIWLKVKPTVSSFFGTSDQTIGGELYQADIFDMRSIDTQVMIPNAHTLVMGGLVQDNPNAKYTKVPILGDIPILGWAFRSENNSMNKDNLLIFITPTIVQNSDFQPAATDFLNSRPITMQDPLNMHSVWDSSQPRGNWSNPVQRSIDQQQQEQSTEVAPTAP